LLGGVTAADAATWRRCARRLQRALAGGQRCGRAGEPLVVCVAAALLQQRGCGVSAAASDMRKQAFDGGQTEPLDSVSHNGCACRDAFRGRGFRAALLTLYHRCAPRASSDALYRLHHAADASCARWAPDAANRWRGTASAAASTDNILTSFL